MRKHTFECPAGLLVMLEFNCNSLASLAVQYCTFALTGNMAAVEETLVFAEIIRNNNREVHDVKLTQCFECCYNEGCSNSPPSTSSR